jgi:hypothetical protein
MHPDVPKRPTVAKLLPQTIGIAFDLWIKQLESVRQSVPLLA